MSRIFITGSVDGLGKLAAKALIAKNHQVVIHARNEQRAQVAKQSLPNAEAVVIGDLASLEQTKILADYVNALGQFDVIIHNAGVYRSSAKDILTVNVLAPYVLTSLIKTPKRLIYLSSGMHLGGKLNLKEVSSDTPSISYSDSKFQVLMLAMAVSRLWPDVYVNTVNPGWVPTKMGGRGAPDDLQKGFETQVWLAEGEDERANMSGHYLFHKQDSNYASGVKDIKKQNQLLEILKDVTGVAFPATNN